MTGATLAVPETRSGAIAWAIAMVELDALVVDTETLGIDHDAGICDLAIVTMEGDVLFNALINPGKPIPADAVRVHGITDADVAGAHSWVWVYPDIERIFSGRVVLAWNAPFDAGSFNACSVAVSRPALAHDWQDAMLAFSAYRGERYVAGRRRGELVWHRLSVAAKQFGIPEGGHRALQDAECCRRLVIAMSEATED